MAANQGSGPGVPPAPLEPAFFPAAAGWRPPVPPTADTPPVRLTASGVFRAVDDERRLPDRRFVERRIRDDGSPYGVERRRGATRTGDRRGAPHAGAERAAPSPPRPAARSLVEYEAHYPDLLARFHGR